VFATEWVELRSRSHRTTENTNSHFHIHATENRSSQLRQWNVTAVCGYERRETGVCAQFVHCPLSGFVWGNRSEVASACSASPGYGESLGAAHAAEKTEAARCGALTSHGEEGE
jgi:hypothetical protein